MAIGRGELRVIVRLARRVAASLLEQSRNDSGLREELHALGRLIVDETSPPQRPRAGVSDALPAVTVEKTLSIGANELTIHVPASATRGTNASPPVPAPAGIRGPVVVAERPPAVQPPRADLRTIAKRARLKAEACRWAIERRRRLEEGADHQTALKPVDDELIGRARSLESCWVWMLDPYQSLPENESLERAAACYDNVALAADLWAGWRQRVEDVDEAPPEELLYVVAEAQSALRCALEACIEKDDRDQLDLFGWLRDQTMRHQIFVHRHMKLDDPADPSDAHGLESRLHELEARWEDERRRERQHRALLNTVRYESRQLQDAAAEEALHHWRKLNETLTRWVAEGNYPSDRRLLDIVEGLADEWPVAVVEPTPEAQQVLAAADRRIADREARLDTAPPPQRQSAELREAASKVRGGVVVLIGGEARPRSREALERDLELTELRWLPTKPHQSLSDFEPHIARSDVTLVLLAVRFTSHMHGDLGALAQKYGKPFVRLRGGYGSNRVAHEILAQASEQLATMA